MSDRHSLKRDGLEATETSNLSKLQLVRHISIAKFFTFYRSLTIPISLQFRYAIPKPCITKSLSLPIVCFVHSYYL